MNNIKNKILTAIIITLLAITSLHAQNSPIANEWEASPQYKEYSEFMEAGDIKSAMQIKRVTTNAITTEVLHEYILDYKEKFRGLILQEHLKLPFIYIDLMAEIHKATKPLLKDKSIQQRHNFVKSLYDFSRHHYEEDGKALKYAKRITKKTPEFQGSKYISILQDMAIDSDREAAKTPEQKQKEHDEYMEKMKIAQEKSERNIEKSERNIEKWNKIIKELKGL